VIHSSLSCLNKLNITLEILDKTEIGKIVNSLHKHPDASIQAKAGTIVSKWKKNVIAPEEPKRPSKPKSKETKIPLPKKQKIEEKIETSENIEEVYIPASPPQEKPIESPPQYVAQPLMDIIDDNTPIKKKVRYVNTLNGLRLIVIDGSMKNVWRVSSTSIRTTNPLQNVHHFDLKTAQAS